MKLQKTLNLVSRIVFNVIAVIFGLTLIFGTIITNASVSELLTDFVFKDRPDNVIVNTGKEPVRYKTWYSSVENNLDGNAQIARLVQAEGTVLLKNDGGALPLAAGEKVSLYGVTAYDPMYSQDGAGNSKINDPQSYSKNSQINRRQFFYDEFKRAGFDVNEKLWQWYNSDAGIHYRRFDTIGFWGRDAGNEVIPALTEANWSEIDENAKDIANYGKDTTAVYITGRMTNEILDLNSEGAGYSNAGNRNNDGIKENTDYLKFTADEKNLLSELGKNYDKVVVILNQANAPQEDLPALFEQYGVDAVLWIAFPGSDGIRSVAEILSGKINPSGGLSAAWYTNRAANPTSQNFGFNTANVVNVEGMYMGYRYAETRYEDSLLGNEGAGTYDYDASISYPFGYGLSYSTFEYTDIELVKDEDPEKNYYTGGLMAANDENYTGNYGKKRPDDELRATGDALGDCDDIIMKVTVKNSGNVAGKEIVQVYLQQPITETDRQHGVQKPAVQLVGFGKTSILEPNASETVEIKIDANKWFAAYDSRINENRGGYVLSAGDYKLVAARNSHEAVNSIYKANGGETASNENFVGEYGIGSADNVETVTVSETRAASYKYWTQGTTDDVHNLFADIDPNMDDSSDNDVDYFSRYDWETTAAEQSNGYIGEDARNKRGGAYGKTNDFHKKDVLNSAKIDKFEEYYGTQFDTEAFTFGNSITDYQLADLIGVEYDPARGASEDDVRKWMQFVGQMSSDDMATLFSNGRRRTVAVPSIGKPATSDENASNGFEWIYALGKDSSTNYGFRNKFNSDAKNCYPTGYPCESTVGATFNIELAYLVGQALGEDALWSGASGLYGFGLGMHRNPYHGRTGEYYSDDPFLTGIMGGYASKGAQEKGLYVYNKHFVLNDQETNRGGFSAWLDEQTFRQIYLRPFEMAIEIGDAMNVMIAFNKLGSAWTGSSYNLMTRWLRGEAGMAGFAVSDWAPSDGEQLGYGILAGSNLLDGPAAGYSAGCDARYDNRLVEAAIQILYTTANSNVMNFIGDDVRIYTYDPLWYATRDAVVPPVTITVYVLFALSAAFVVGTTAWGVVAEFMSKKSLMR